MSKKNDKASKKIQFPYSGYVLSDDGKRVELLFSNLYSGYVLSNDGKRVELSSNLFTREPSGPASPKVYSATAQSRNDEELPPPAIQPVKSEEVVKVEDLASMVSTSDNQPTMD